MIIFLYLWKSNEVTGGTILAFVGFGDNGYDYFNKSSHILFSADNTHKYLFDYIAYNLSPLSGLIEKHISKRVDFFTFDFKNSPDDDIDEINKIKEILVPAHPYYRYEYKKVIIKAIGDYFNQLLLYEAYAHNKLPPNYPLDQEWYYSNFRALIPVSLVSAGDYPEGLFPLDFHHKYKTLVDDMGYRIDEVEESLIPDVPSGIPTGFSEEFQTQASIKKMLYFLLDTQAQGLENLSIPQRIWLYGNTFRNPKNLSEISVTKKLLFSSPPAYLKVDFDKNKDAAYQNEHLECSAKINDIFYPFYTYETLNITDTDIPENMRDSINSAIQYAKTIDTSKVYEEYEINCLQELLSLEIMAMLQSETLIKKCENCNRYFVRNDKKKKYCDRISESGATCYIIAKKKRFQQKIENDPAFKLYNTAYKTHFAQYKRGNMTKTEFNSWQYEAQTKLNQVRLGELNIATFQKYLSK